MTDISVGDYVQIIWGWPGPDYDVAIVTKVNEGGSFFVRDMPDSMAIHCGKPRIEAIRIGGPVVKVERQSTLQEYHARYGK